MDKNEMRKHTGKPWEEVRPKLSENQIGKLTNILKRYNRDICPDELYPAWKILILGTNEYNKGKDGFLFSAWNFCSQFNMI